MSKNFSYERTNQPKRKSSPLLPVIGLVLVIAAGVGGWLVAPAIIDALPANSLSDIPMDTLRIVITVIIALLALIVFGLVAALVTPKDGQSVREKDLAREKDERNARAKAERAAARRRR